MPFTTAFSQVAKDSVVVKDFGTQMVDYSRPGKYHQMLGELVGTWTNNGRHFTWWDSVSDKVLVAFKTTVVRKPFADGRFFFTEETGEVKIEMPVRDGKMKEDLPRVFQIEGYNNVKAKFNTVFISNHIGSDVTFMEGSYDSSGRIITYNYEEELVPGTIGKVRQLFIFKDKDHYTIELYQLKDGKFIKASEMVYTRAQ
jgi:hypothetical protein